MTPDPLALSSFEPAKAPAFKRPFKGQVLSAYTLSRLRQRFWVATITATLSILGFCFQLWALAHKHTALETGLPTAAACFGVFLVCWLMADSLPANSFEPIGPSDWHLEQMARLPGLVTAFNDYRDDVRLQDRALTRYELRAWMNLVPDEPRPGEACSSEMVGAFWLALLTFGLFS